MSFEQTATRPYPATRDAFVCFRPLQTRWADNDAYGHMNNVVHYALFDTAINGWLVEAGLLDIARSNIIGVVVETGCRYHAGMAFPDAVTAGIRAERIGHSSVAYIIALFRGHDESAAAEGRFVHVYVDRATRKPVSLPDSWRKTLETIAR